jgi:uroporphyrinogen decarboxylase
MNSRERISAMLNGQTPDRLPFCPAMYEHKALLMDRAPAEVAKSADLLYDAMLAEYETYKPDMLTVGIDIYNIEAQALGAEVIFSERPGAVPVITERILKTAKDVNSLKQVDPEISGRMPVMLDTAARVNEKFGSEVFVRGAVSGPFSMAAELMGIEPLLIAAVTEPQATVDLLDFCTEIAVAYATAFIKRGVQVCIFDSQSAPPFVSPVMYCELILPRIGRLISNLKEAGAIFSEYVVGGDTSANASHLFATGAQIILSDFISDVKLFLKQRQDKRVLIRRNISPIVIEQGEDKEIREQTQEIISLARSNQGIIIGTGVLSYNTRPEKIKLIKSIVEEN